MYFLKARLNNAAFAIEMVVEEKFVQTIVMTLFEENERVVAYTVSPVGSAPVHHDWTPFSPPPTKQFSKWVTELPSSPISCMIC